MEVEKMTKSISKIYLTLMLFFLYTPLLFLAYYSFASSGNMVSFDSFTLDNYKEFFSNQRLIMIVVNTIIIALLSALGATILGVFGALTIFAMKQMKQKNTLLVLNNILIVSPDVIIGSSFLLLFTVVGLKLGFSSVLIAHIAFSVPIVVLMILPKLQEMPLSMIAAARDLGASWRQVLTHVVIPFLSPGIFGGFFMALTYSLDDFAVTFFVTGGGFQTLSVEIYSMARQGVSLQVNALSTLLFVIIFVIVIVYYFIQTNKRKQEVR